MLILKQFSLVAASLFVMVSCKTTSQASITKGEVNQNRNFTIISDLDDTVKITDVGNKLKAATNSLFGTDLFVGFSELYQGLVLNSQAPVQPNRLTFLSGSPELLHDKISVILRENFFPDSAIYLRAHWPLPDIVTHKSTMLPVIAKNYPTGSFILIGDDTEKDPETYLDFAASAAGAGKVAAIYIHRIVGRDLPTGVIPIYTAFDIATAEVRAGRLSELQGKLIFERILKVGLEKPNLVFPDYVFCPEKFDDIPTATDNLRDSQNRLFTFTANFCHEANADSKRRHSLEAFLKMLGFGK